MSNKKPVVVKGKFSFKGSDGNECELGFVIPGEVSSKIFKDILDWKEIWLWTAKEYEEYQEVEKSFLAELKGK